MSNPISQTAPIKLPDYNSKDAVFLVLLLKGHTLYIDNLPELVGFQDAPQRAFRLRAMGIPIESFKQTLKPKYPHPVAFYSLDNGFIQAVGEERIQAFIERVTDYFANVGEIKKGLQSKPQPLSSILAGKL